METSKHLLVAHDGTTGSDAVLRLAAAIFPGARTTVLHVSKSIVDWGIAPRIHMPDNDQFDAWVLEAAQARLDVAVDRARGLGLDADGRLRTTARAVWRTLLDAADELDPDLLLVGIHAKGRTGIRRLGSVAHGAIAHARHPVLVVHPDDPEPPSDFGIAVAFDDSDGARVAVDSLGRLLPGHDVVIASAWEPMSAWVTVPSAGAPPLGMDVDLELEREADRRVETGCERAAGSGLDARPLALRAEHGIARALRDGAVGAGASLLCVGARAATGIPVVALGGVAHALIADAPMPVLVVHPSS